MPDYIEELDGSLTRVAGKDGRKTVRNTARAVETKMVELIEDTAMRRDFDPKLAGYLLASDNDAIQEPMVNFIIEYLGQICIGGGDPEVIATARKMLAAIGI